MLAPLISSIRSRGTHARTPFFFDTDDNATLVAANGLLLVSSGYSLVGSQSGKVLLAFKFVE